MKVFPQLESALEDPEVELVVIASPNNTHYTFAVQALKANKNVVIGTL